MKTANTKLLLNNWKTDTEFGDVAAAALLE